MVDFAVLPDSEYLTVKILKAAVDVGASGPFGAYVPRIGTRLPAEPVWADGIAQVQRVGGMPSQRRWLDHANIQIDVWHDTKEAAHNIAQIARVVMHRAEGKKYTAPAAVLTGVEDSTGLAWQFDTMNLKPRYTFRLYLTVHP